MSQLSIQVTVRQAYGQERVYPVCDKAKLFASLIGGKIFSPDDLRIIGLLGYKIEFIPQTVSIGGSNETTD